MSEILNFNEACELLRVSKPTLYRYIRSGEIPAFKVGRNWKFHRQALNDWVQQQMQANSQNQKNFNAMAISTIEK